MKSVVNFFDNLPLIVKILFALPVLDGILWGTYRICKGHVIAGIIWIFIGAAIGWIVDIITLAVNKKVTLFAE